MSESEVLGHFENYKKRFGFILELGADSLENFLIGFITYLSDESWRN